MQIWKTTRPAGLLAAIGFAAQLAGCGGGSGTAVAQGTLRVALTNTGSAACGYDAVNIAVDAVRVNQNANAVPGDAGWQPADVPLALAQAKKVDLLALTSGSPQELVTMTVPAAHYTQVRLWLEQSSVLMVKPNWVTLSGSADKIALDTSNTTSIRVPHAFTVPANGQVNLTLDFDACGSVVDTGNNTLQLVPVITATSGA